MFTRFISFCTAFLILLFTSVSNAQDPEIDSLNLLLKNKKNHDTTRLNLIGEIIGRLRVSDPAVAVYNKTVGEICFRNLKNRNLTTKERKVYYYNLGFWYADKVLENYSVSNAQNVLFNYDKSIYYFTLAGDDYAKWNAMANKAQFLVKLGAVDEATTSFFDILKQQEAAGDTEGTVMTLSGIGKIYELQGNQRKAVFYYKKVLKIQEAMKDPQAQQLYEKAITLHNIGAMYSHIGESKTAREYFARSLKIDKENGFNDQAAFNADQLASIYVTEKNYSAALASISEGLALSENKRSRAVLLSTLGHTHFEQGDFKKAETAYRESLQLAEEIDDLEIKQFEYLNLYQTYKKTNRPVMALEMYEKYVIAHNNIENEDSKNALEQQQLKYDFEKREIVATAKAQKKLDATRLAGEKAAARRNLFIYILLSLALILGGIIWFLYYFFRQKAIQNLHRNEELKQKLLLSQMNPHFIFNSVDNIQSLIYQKKDDEAVKYLTRFSKLTRQILEHSRENYVLLSEEIEMLTNYLSIQQLLYNSSFSFEILTDADLDTEMVLVPPMLSQPFIENAIKHGLKDLEKNGKVVVRYTMKNGKLMFEVTDNGSGFGVSKSGHKSLSTQITRERLESISPESEIRIETSDIYENNLVQGAKTRFEIPYILNN